MKSEIVEHLKRTWKRYRSEKGDTLAASVSYYAFLSFFPLILLALSVVGYVVRGSASAQQKIVDQIQDVLPGAIVGPGGINVESISQQSGTIGLIALVGLVVSGTGWIAAMRSSLRRMWGAEDLKVNFAVNKLIDIGMLAALGLVLGLSVAASGLGSQGTEQLIDLFNMENTDGARTTIKLVGLLLPFLVDIVVFGFLFSALPHVRTRTRSLIKGAVLGAVLFEILKFVGAYYIARTTKGAAIYGTFAVVIGLVVWLNLVMRLTLLTGAWTATALPMPGVSALDVDSPATEPGSDEADADSHAAEHAGT